MAGGGSFPTGSQPGSCGSCSTGSHVDGPCQRSEMVLLEPSRWHLRPLRARWLERKAKPQQMVRAPLRRILKTKFKWIQEGDHTGPLSAPWSCKHSHTVQQRHRGVQANNITGCDRLYLCYWVYGSILELATSYIPINIHYNEQTNDRIDEWMGACRTWKQSISIHMEHIRYGTKDLKALSSSPNPFSLYPEP